MLKTTTLGGGDLMELNLTNGEVKFLQNVIKKLLNLHTSKILHGVLLQQDMQQALEIQILTLSISEKLQGREGCSRELVEEETKDANTL